MWPFVSGYSRLAQCFPDASTLQHISTLSFFYGWIIFHCRINHTLFIHSSTTVCLIIFPVHFFSCLLLVVSLAGCRTSYMILYDFNFSFISLISFFFCSKFQQISLILFFSPPITCKTFLVTIFLISSNPVLFSSCSFFIRGLFYISLSSHIHCVVNQMK